MMWGFPCSSVQVIRLVGHGASTGGFLAPAAGLACPRYAHPADSLCLMVISGLEQGFSSVEGLVALQTSDSAANSREKACPLPDMHFTAQQQPGCVSLLLPALPCSHKWDVKGKQPQSSSQGSCVPWWWRSCTEQSPVPLSLCELPEHFSFSRQCHRFR